MNLEFGERGYFEVKEVVLALGENPKFLWQCLMRVQYSSFFISVKSSIACKGEPCVRP